MPTVSIDYTRRENLPLPDGRPVRVVRRLPFAAEMLRLKVPGITPDMGKMAMAEKYEALVLDKARSIQSEQTRGKVYPGQETIARAVAAIGGKA